MFFNFIAVALGGAIGSMLRYGCTLLATQLSWKNWVATLAVNVLGSFLIGVLAGIGVKNRWNLFATVGMCGGFTTFSTFSLQNIQMLQEGQYMSALANISFSLALCLLAVALGLFLGKTISKL